MIREIFVPDKPEIRIPIPKEFVHKKVELILFPLAGGCMSSVKRKAGSAKGAFEIMDDFDAPIEDFKEYVK
jgi:hypothetical protein